MGAILGLIMVAAGLATIVGIFKLVGFWGGLFFVLVLVYGASRR